MRTHYFDWAATTPISDKALQTYVETAKNYSANPSALHAEGKKARQFLEEQRAKIAKLLNVESKQLVFTGGATESNAIVLNSLLLRPKAGAVIFTTLEHDSILQYSSFLSLKGFKVELLKGNKGYITTQSLENLLTDDTQLVSVMLVSNVLGTIQNIKELVEVVRSYEKRGGRKIHFHCDATQALGKIDFDLDELGFDSASFSAHKINGPRGVGLLYLKSKKIEVLSRGGSQEMGLRGGTENVAAIAAMGCAIEESLTDLETKRLKAIKLRILFEKKISNCKTVKLLSPNYNDNCVANILTLATNTPSEVFTRILYDKGFCVSSGSACSNNAPNKKNNLLLLNDFTEKEAANALRISFGHDTTEEQITILAETICLEAEKFNAMIRSR
jgi:cysteine desulfurase